MNIISKPINDTDNTNKLIESNTNNTNKVFIKNEDILKYTDYFNNNVNLYVSKFGGHSSFFSGFFLLNHDWFMRKLDLFFESFINE